MGVYPPASRGALYFALNEREYAPCALFFCNLFFCARTHEFFYKFLQFDQRYYRYSHAYRNEPFHGRKHEVVARALDKYRLDARRKHDEERKPYAYEGGYVEGLVGEEL